MVLFLKTVFYNVKLSAVVCDAPVRAFVKGIKSHTGYSGCDKCTQPGVYENGKMTFPLTNAPIRTDESFAKVSDEEHHKRPNPFRSLSSLGMVSRFPIDYMHLVCLGVMKRLLLIWLKGPLDRRIGVSMRSLISDYLVIARSNICKEFARKTRSLDEIARWKATEFRTFLLYVGPVILKIVKIDKPLYDNFMLLTVAIRILASPSLYASHWAHANTLLVSFVNHYSQLYGSDMVTYNVHGLTHLAHDARLLGPLDSFSSFPFENYLGKLKNLVRQPRCVLQQVVQRCREISHRQSFEIEANSVPKVKKLHTSGPLPDYEMYFHATQHGEALHTPHKVRTTVSKLEAI